MESDQQSIADYPNNDSNNTHCIQLLHRATTHRLVVSINDKLQYILDEFCTQHNLIQSHWNLFNRKTRAFLDINKTIQQNGIEYNCTIELIASATAPKSTSSSSAVRVLIEQMSNSALEISSAKNELLVHNTSKTLYDILEQLGSDTLSKQYNDKFVQPIISVNGSVYDTTQLLCSTTLKSIGIKNSVKLRLSYKLSVKSFDAGRAEIIRVHDEYIAKQLYHESSIESQRTINSETRRSSVHDAITTEQDVPHNRINAERRDVSDVHRVNNREELFEYISDDIDELATQTDAPNQLFTTALNVLYKIVDNLVNSRHTRQHKYRTLKIDASALHSKLTKYPASVQLLQHLGFVPDLTDGSRYTMNDDTEDEILIDNVHELIRLAKEHEETMSITYQSNHADSATVLHSQTQPQPQQSHDTQPFHDNNAHDGGDDSDAAAYDREIQRLRDEADRLEQQRTGIKSSKNNSNFNDTSMSNAITDDINDSSKWHELDRLRSPEPEFDDRAADEDMRAIERDYNIADVRIALNTLFDELNQNKQQFQSVTELLMKITNNLLQSTDAKYRTINLTNKVLSSKLSPYTGAIQYLLFIGYNYADSNNPLLLTLSGDNEDSFKIQRAMSILKRVMNEQQLNDDELDAIRLGPIQRNIQLFHYNPSYATQRSNTSMSTSTSLPSPTSTDIDNDSRHDLKLLMSASAESRARYEQLSRTDIIVTKSKREEMKKELERKYDYCVVRVIITDNNQSNNSLNNMEHAVMIQSYYRAYERLEDVINTIRHVLSDTNNSIELLLPPNTKLIQSTHGTQSLKQLSLQPACTLICRFVGDVSPRSLLSKQYVDTIQPMNQSSIETPRCVNLHDIEQAKARHAAMFSTQSQTNNDSSATHGSIESDDDMAELRRLKSMRKSTIKPAWLNK